MRRMRTPVVAICLSAALLAPARALAQDAAITPRLAQVEDRVTQLRHLDSSGAVHVQFVTPDQAAAAQRTAFFRDNSPQQLEAEQLLLETLGYIPPGGDMTQTVLGVLDEDSSGFYDPTTKTVYVVGAPADLDSDQEAALAHELVQALDDQHFQIKENQDAREPNNDQALAYQALVEGEASLAETLYSLRYLPQTDDDTDEEASLGQAFEDAPLVLQRELLFPYDEGIDFLLDPFLDESWDGLNAIWANPPASTAQVLHPEKYDAGIGPTQLALPDLTGQLGGGWTVLDDNTLGELDLRSLFEQYLDPQVAVDAADGWAGDHYQLLRRDADGAVIVAMRTTWDSVTDARQFFTAYQQVARARSGADLQELTESEVPLSTPAPTAAWAAQADGVFHVLVRDGNGVALVVGGDPAALDLADALR